MTSSSASRRLRRLPLLLAVLLTTSACQPGGEGDDAAKDGGQESAPVPVETQLPVRGDVHAVYSGTAPIEAYAEAEVIAKVGGEVREILVEEGHSVRKGEVLARLDGDRLRLELSEKEAQLRKLERDFERNVDLRNKGLISEGDFDKIRYEMEALKASYNLAKLELDYTQIRAPIDGVVSERYIKLGNTIDVGTPLFRVTSLDPLVAYLHVPEREYRRIDPGQPAAIRIDALGGDPVLAPVTRVSPTVDPATGTFKITIEIEDEANRIKPGMFGRISIVYDERENALKIPRAAIVEEQGEARVYVIEDGVAVRKAVETGYSDSGFVEILSGLGDDERVVTVGQANLKAGAKVNVVNEPAASDGVEKELAQGDQRKGSDNASID